MARNKPLEKYTKTHFQIVQEALRHENETGYLSLRLDNEFYLVENSFQFIAGDFDRSEFTIGDNNPIVLPPGQKVTDAFYIYFVITLGGDNVTQWKFRKLILEVS